jgi:hypothetical protein
MESLSHAECLVRGLIKRGKVCGEAERGSRLRHAVQKKAKVSDLAEPRHEFGRLFGPLLMQRFAQDPL